MINFTEKQTEIICKSTVFGILAICIGFVVSMCLYWPKDFRGGVFNKLDEIGARHQENAHNIEALRGDLTTLINKLEEQTEFQYNKTYDR